MKRFISVTYTIVDEHYNHSAEESFCFERAENYHCTDKISKEVLEMLADSLVEDMMNRHGVNYIEGLTLLELTAWGESSELCIQLVELGDDYKGGYIGYHDYTVLDEMKVDGCELAAVLAEDEADTIGRRLEVLRDGDPDVLYALVCAADMMPGSKTVYYGEDEREEDYTEDDWYAFCRGPEYNAFHNVIAEAAAKKIGFEIHHESN